ncbi:uncharacterized protein LOC129723758 isoform X1 [Wyeomyia smithii]|uniref:uncharacterized protein LOC129723758 isoform X1 n=1 Tax=Wyeomyia smithii TaxID=174621 RepID=UPI00246807B5|nr:uncharacterized protein LOC129723758 isoform X1 [Wyeomyia smithii]XP_055534135.1 uncharacterized protein LOC129723758 isoform X1 [Wyeomyia smithii]
MRAVLVDILGDTLAVHDVLGMLSPSAKMFCRTCYANRDSLKAGELGDNYPARTVASTKSDLEALQAGKTTPGQVGLVRDCSFHKLKYFHMANNLTFDPMHDLLEGVAGMVIKLFLRDALNKKNITIGEINRRINDFDYGDAEKGNKPSANFTVDMLKKKTNCISQSAAQTWSLLRAFPFLFSDCFNQEDNSVEMLHALQKITYYSFSNSMNRVMIDDLQHAINTFHREFCAHYPDNIINKIHHLSHYPAKVMEKGPLVNDSCMLFESEFKGAKGQAKNCNNFRNITFSLAKRLNLKQINDIINHHYDIERKTVFSTRTVNKNTLEYKSLLFDLPEEITMILHYSCDETSFAAGLTVKYRKCGYTCYGIIITIVDVLSEYVFIIQELEMIEFCRKKHAYKTTISQRIHRTTESNISKRKTYSLWKCSSSTDETYYISLKYFDE